MTDQQKKITQIAVIVVGFALAAAITAYNFDFFGGGVSGVSRPLYMKCTNPDCGASYEITIKEYRKMLEEEGYNQMMPGPEPMERPAFTCKKCGQKTAYLAEKCEKCGAIFIPDYEAEDTVEIYRCPECGYSRYE